MFIEATDTADAERKLLQEKTRRDALAKVRDARKIMTKVEPKVASSRSRSRRSWRTPSLMVTRPPSHPALRTARW
jgi:hypothetical protein